jgi:hypothetical protein
VDAVNIVSFQGRTQGGNNATSIAAFLVASISLRAATMAGYHHRFLLDTAAITAHLLVVAWSGRSRTLRRIDARLPPTQRLAQVLALALLFGSKLVDAAE